MEAVCQQKREFIMHITFDPVFPSFRIYPANKLGNVHKVKCTKWSLIALFVTAKHIKI